MEDNQKIDEMERIETLKELNSRQDAETMERYGAYQDSEGEWII